MTLLNDRKIKEYVNKGIINIKPFDENAISPASYDLKLGFRFRVFENYNIEVIDIKNYKDDLIEVRENQEYREEIYKYSRVIELKDKNLPIIIHPNEFILASIYEYIKLPKNIAAQIQGRSSLARLGLIIHTSAGWVDPGYEGHLTLEIINVNKVPIKLYPLMRIAQIQFIEMDEESEIGYNERKSSKYLKERGATNSLIYKDFII